MKINWNNKQAVCDYAKRLAGSCNVTMVVYKHPERDNYNITHMPTFERHGYPKSWIVLRVPPTHLHPGRR